MCAEFTPHAGEAVPGTESIGRRAHVEHRLGIFPRAAGLAGGASREIRIADVELARALHAHAAIDRAIRVEVGRDVRPGDHAAEMRSAIDVAVAEDLRSLLRFAGVARSAVEVAG